MMKKENNHILEVSYPFWQHLNSEEKQEMSWQSSIKHFEKGEFVHGGDEDCLGVMTVISGQLRVYIQSEDGREVTLFRLEQGEVCTLSASCAMEEISFDIFIDAVEKTELLITTVALMNRLMQDNVYVENYIYKHTAERFSDVIWAISQILFSSVDKRVAGYLLDEVKRTKSSNVKFTHEQIAKNLGTAREVVSRMLKYFEKEGLVSLSRGMVTVKDQSGLQKLL